MKKVFDILSWSFLSILTFGILLAVIAVGTNPGDLLYPLKEIFTGIGVNFFQVPTH